MRPVLEDASHGVFRACRVEYFVIAGAYYVIGVEDTKGRKERSPQVLGASLDMDWKDSANTGSSFVLHNFVLRSLHYVKLTVIAQTVVPLSPNKVCRARTNRTKRDLTRSSKETLQACEIRNPSSVVSDVRYKESPGPRVCITSKLRSQRPANPKPWSWGDHLLSGFDGTTLRPTTPRRRYGVNAAIGFSYEACKTME